MLKHEIVLLVTYHIEGWGWGRKTGLQKALTTHNWQNEKEYFWHVPAMKFIGMK